MKTIPLLVLFTAVSFAFCPLGFTPEEACTADNPSCALYMDDNCDGLCDNPEPQDETESEPDQEEVEEAPQDTVTEETEEEKEIPYIEESAEEQQEELPVDSTPPDESFFTGVTSEITVGETADSLATVEEIVIELPEDSTDVGFSSFPCPLDLSPEEACTEDSQRCGFFSDLDEDLLCDNPEGQTDSIAEVEIGISETTSDSKSEASGCPLGLTSETACNSLENRLCPHFRGGEACINPSGGGIHRTLVILVFTAILLTAATILKRQLRGRSKSDRHKRKIAHITVQTISLLVLGFFVQGSYCPLGVFQYLFLPGGIGFLGEIGIAVLLLPLLWSVFVGRIYCGWVCPFGALQDLLGKLNVPRPPVFSGKVHRFLVKFKYFLAIIFVVSLILAGKGFFGNIIPASLFCQIDPFHTIFSYFMIGSFAGAIAAIIVLIFYPRLFCKYLCFYGAILSLLGRIRLWRGIKRKRSSFKTP